MDEPIPGAEIVLADPDNLMNFNVTIKPTDGLYKGATFKFTVDVPNSYPYDPPKVLCTTMVTFYSGSFLTTSRYTTQILTGRVTFV